MFTDVRELRVKVAEINRFDYEKNSVFVSNNSKSSDFLVEKVDNYFYNILGLFS